MASLCPTEHIEFTIFNNLLGLDELVNVSMVNKTYYLLAKREIKKIYQIIEKIRKSKIQVNTSSLYNTETFDCTYDNQYWYQLFGRKLNNQELAIYYSYFITKYYMNGKHWSCVAYKDGFIKSLGAQSDGSITINQNEPEIYIRFKNYYSDNITIEFQEKFYTINHRQYIDEKLLNKIIKYIIQNSKKKFLYQTLSYKTTIHNINDAIIYLYPIINI
jgi:hypothetical protein